MEKFEKLTGKQQLATLKRLLSYAKPYKKSLAWTLILTLIVTLGNLATPLLIKYILDNFIQDKSTDIAALSLWTGITLATFVVTSLVWYVEQLRFQKTAFHIVQDLRTGLFQDLQKKGMRFYDQVPSGSIVSRLTNDTEAITDMFVSVLSTAVSAVFMLTGIYITMFILNVKLALICLLLLPISIWIIFLYQKYSTTFYQQAREKLSEMNAKLAESISGMPIIQQFSQEKRLRNEFSETNEAYFEASFRNTKLNGLLLGPAIQLLSGLGVAIILFYFGWASFSGAVSVGVVFVFISYIQQLFNPIQQIMERLAFFQQAVVASSRIFKMMDNHEYAPKQAETTHRVIKKGEVEFKNVSFSYDGKQDVLSNISFVARPGETVALVGHTGSGKSSIINLMMRFYEFERGDILIDGVSIKEYPTAELREKMGLVLQDSFLYYGTISDNIRLKNENLTQAQIEEAAEFVQADRFINEFPNGYEHRVVERGAAFSQGQKQLLSFARTIVTDPKILVLDEATASIDTETEQLIQEGLVRIRQGRTTIAIAHRLSTIRDAEQILVLDHGKIVERGTHDELVAQRGIYFSMYELQNKSETVID
ncbi:ABC transporter ATP-binding protein [Brochothrix thermosphacta]|uniref:ABC transporter ATP-binding protein n=1 Tax=Brochothrix thermosphacta TaxID=2756 RepID=UPI000EDD60B3|nr:ABC transporter ATP-binding protein [Brochothrix thermosphacta]HCZ38244.1 multidrug ABC transporter ATP-binding protein [Brochothrix thermosphacta]HCZ46308.1 multidrug ABC transporter ATP-binding protein [Brochothrix thermosphacta]